MNILQRLYASEINASVETFWDNGYRVKLGDPLNGYRAETTVQTWNEVEVWLEEQACRHFPSSEFTRQVRTCA